MFALVGMWLAIAGYGLAYAGAYKLGGGDCGFLAGFRGQCKPSTTTKSATSGQTQQGRLLNQQSQQAGMIGTLPIVQVM